MSKDKIREIYEFFFKTADADGDGFVSGGEAAAMFRKSGISDELLRNIWAQVSQGQPHLNKSAFFMALGLIGLAQAGRDPKISDLGVGKMLAPTFAGITPPGSQLTLLQPEMLSSPSTAVSSSPSALSSPLSPVVASGSASSLPALTPVPSVPAPTPQTSSQVSSSSIVWSVSDAQKVTSAQYFATLDVKNSGALGGAEAKDFFLKSELPAPELAVIWALSDIDGDGKLSLQEFQIAFFLTQQRRNKLDLPNSLPPSIFESVGLPVPTTVTLVSPVLTPGGSAPNSKQGSMLEVHAHVAHETGNTFSPAPTANTSHPTGTPPHNNSSHATPNNASPAGSKSSSFGSMSDIHATSSPIPIASPIANLSTHLSGSLSKMPEISEEEELKSPTSSSAVSPSPVVTSSSVPLVPIASSRPANQDFRLTMQFDAATMKAMLEQEKAAAGGFQPLASGAPSSIPVHLQTTSSNADEWILTNDVKATYDTYFARADELGSGFVSGPRARELFTKASLPNAVLAEIWSLSDANNDGQLDRAEFALAMHLINLARRGIKPPAVLPYVMLESAGVNPKTLAEVRDKAAAKERAQKEAQAALEQQAAYEAALKRQEEERVEVGHMKAQIAQLLREKEAAVKSLRAQQTANVSLAQHLARADFEADTLRLDVSQMELQVEKAKIKGASVKEHSESMMRNLAAATEDKATLEALLQQRRTQYLTEAAALNALETQLADNRTALARQTQDIASLRASVAALQRAKDERASRAFDPQVLQQKLAQEKLRQDFAAARAASASSLAKSHASHQHSHPSNGNSDSATPTSAFEVKPAATADAFAHSTTDDWVSFPASSSQNASSSSFGNVVQQARVYDDFGSVRGAATVAVPKSFGFEMEEDDFGKPAAASAAVAIENTAARAATPTTEMASAVSPTAFANEPLSLDDDFFIPNRPEKPLSPTTTEKDEKNAYPQPDDDFFAPAATGPSASATFASAGNTNPFPAFDDKNGESEAAATKGGAQTNAFGEVDDFAPLPNPAVHVYTSHDDAEADKKDGDAEADIKAAQLQDGPSISVAENTLEVQAPAINAVQQVQEESVSTNSAAANTNPFPASAAAADEGFASAFLSNNSTASSASFDDLFASVPAAFATSEATPIMFGSTDDLFGPSAAGSAAAPVSSSASDSSFRNAFDEKLFDD